MPTRHRSRQLLRAGCDITSGGVTITRRERALLSLEGLSLGDAFGETFFTGEPLQLVRERRLRDGPWRWTDDTAMAICVVQTLAAFEFVNQNDLARRFAERFLLEPDRGYGPGAQRILGDINAGHYWRAASHALFSGQGSFGNGAAMRAPVLGAWFAHDPDSIVQQAHRSAEITHAHPEGIAGAIAVALAASLACRGDACPAGGAFLEAVLAGTPDGEVADGLRRALALGADEPIERAAEALGNGATEAAHDTVPLALWCAAQHLTDYERALWLTVAALGDRDTTCAIVGGIVACRVGHEGLPAQWLQRREPLPASTLP